MAGEKILIDTFRKNSSEVVKVHLQRFAANENRYLDVRVFMVDVHSTGSDEHTFEGIATKKGLTVRVELLDRLVEALNRARVALDSGNPIKIVDSLHGETRKTRERSKNEYY